MGVRYYHGSRGNRYSNGLVFEFFRFLVLVFAWLAWIALTLVVAAVLVIAAGLAWVVTWGKWSGSRALGRASFETAAAAGKLKVFS